MQSVSNGMFSAIFGMNNLVIMDINIIGKGEVCDNEYSSTEHA